MGRQRFRLVDMLPNSWFYRHKEKNVATRTPLPANKGSSENPSYSHPPPLPSKQLQQHPIKPGRPSNYIPSNEEQRSTHFPSSPLHPKASDTKFLPDSPRKSKKKSRKVLLNRPSSSKPQTAAAPPPPPPPPIPDVEVDSIPIIDLPPILTRPKKREEAELIPKSPMKRSGGGGHGIRVRSNSPRLAAKKVHQPRGTARSGDARKGLAGSFPVVKSSANPQKDFRESMVEMIVENNITSVEEMEELLSCYLSLNSKQYHDVIVDVFKQIWLQLS